MRTRWVACLLAVLAVGIALGLVALAVPIERGVAASSSDWPAYLAGPSHPSVSGSTSITTANAAALHLAWNRSVGGLNASPTVYNGVVYIGNNSGYFWALDLATGATKWRVFVGKSPAITPGCTTLGVTSTATLAPDPVSGEPMVYVGGGDQYLYALHASNGTLAWKTVVGALNTTGNGYYNWSSPTVLGGKIYLGLSTQCELQTGFVRGGVQQFDQHTGALQHSFWGVPAGATGGGVFTSVAAEGGTVWATTGSAPEPPAAQGDSYSVVQLTGALHRVGAWTVPATQRLGDSDFGSSPTLFDAPLAGTRTRMVGACNKNGVFYAFRAQNVAAGPVWQRKVGTARSINGRDSCLAAAIWDGARLIVPSNQTKIGATTYNGSLRGLVPATGAVVWERGLPSNVLGTPSENASGVIAAATYDLTGGTVATYLLNAATGSILATIPTGTSEFAQPVFAGQNLLLATLNQGLKVYRP